MTLLSPQEQFAEWLAVPKDMREPKTQKELAVLLDISPNTLTRWKKDPDLQAQVYTLAHDRLEAALPDIMQVIIDNALAGKFQFVRLSLELTEKYSSKITVQGAQPQLGIEQYADLIKQIETWEAERTAEPNDE